MIITNLKKFEEICRDMKKFCKLALRYGQIEQKPYHYVFFMDKNFMCATNGNFMAIRNIADCIINDETFAFPCTVKPTKVVTSDGEKFIIENKKEDYFSKDKREVVNFDWKRVIPTDKPRVTKEYDFSAYNPNEIQSEKYSTVTFCDNGDVVFYYDDYCETIGVYSDVQIIKDDFFDSVDDTCITTLSYPMYQINWILNDNKKFIYEEYCKNGNYVGVFNTNNYKFVVAPMMNEIMTKIYDKLKINYL
jgi:hypothetical protein